ncbi:hypothetical protein C0Q70_03628 [Pomacea canaliculata]|uniref:Chloride channel protein n=1 Tax=Pomacea canaliculata TaxID=400727 RepID=A0A2T7PT87_POMCA|nr:hypothetical protein C0Q70_03628 [Pomacea canaliculata]
MAERQKFGYEQTLLYGQYTRELGTFAKFQAKRLKKYEAPEQLDIKRPYGLLAYLDFCRVIRDAIFNKIGEDWVFLTILGILMALLSFAMDFIIEKCQEAKFWLYDELKFSVPLQYFAWVSYSLLLILFAVGFSHIVSPQAIGSGIPEMKTILRGVVLKEYLTFRTLVAKVVGLCASLGSTLPIGKEGPFVHVASMVATVLSKFFSSFKGLYENESRRSEMLAAACAVGVACTYAAPIGGVLFSIEVTSSYFAVRNYWRGFYSAVCGALVFRLLDYWYKDQDTITAMFKTNLRTEIPFDVLELFAFSAIGIACGFAGALFILMHRRVVLFTRKHKKLSAFLQKNRFIYPGVVTLVITSLTFPPGLGQFFAGQLTNKRAINELFSNMTWATGQTETLNEETILSHWQHPLTNIYVTLVLFVIMNFVMAVFSNTMPLPAGVFVPVFTIGAGFGRLVGESMAAWFPEGIPSGDTVRKIVPGGYAVVGAASFAGSVTRTISTSVIVFEVTGQISHVLPAVLAVLIANAVANVLQPSFYDSIIRLRCLPYLPDIQTSKANTWRLFVEDFMIRDVKYVPFTARYIDIQNLLLNTYHRAYPLVDSPGSMILLGSIQRYELERMLLVQLTPDVPVIIHHDNVDLMDKSNGRPPTPPTIESIDLTPQERPLPRFTVTRVDEDEREVNIVNDVEKPKIEELSPNLLRVPSRLSLRSVESAESADSLESSVQKNYNTVHVPLHSILKKPSASPKLTRRASTGDLKEDLNQFYRKLAKRHKEGRMEDRPFKITSAVSMRWQKNVKRVRGTCMGIISIIQEEWENSQLSMPVDWEGVQIDPAPFQLVERTSLHKVHSLFSLLGLGHAYVTNTGRLVGVVSLKELRTAIQGQLETQAANKGKQRSKNDEDDDEDNEVPIVLEELEVEHRLTPKEEYRLHAVNLDINDHYSSTSRI